MAYSLDNFVRATLQADVTADATTVTIAKASEPLRDPPDATEDAPGVLVIQDAPASPTKIEILTYTGRSIEGNVVTLTGCTRGAEGTTAEAWTAGVPTFAGFTAGILGDMQEQIASKASAGAATAVTDWNAFVSPDFSTVASTAGATNGPGTGASSYVGLQLPYSNGNTGGQIAVLVSSIATELWFRGVSGGTGSTWRRALTTDDSSGFVPTTRKVNGKSLNGDVTLSAADVGALASTGTAAAATKLATARTIAGKSFDGTANITLAASDVGAATTAQGAKADAASAAIAALSPSAAQSTTDWDTSAGTSGATFVASTSGASHGPPSGVSYCGVNLPHSSGNVGGQVLVRVSSSTSELWFRGVSGGTGAPWLQAMPTSGGDFSGAVSAPTMRLTAETDVSLTSTGHAFQIGPDSGSNIRMDGNEIMSVNNGATDKLYLQKDGGAVKTGGDVNVGGDLGVTGAMTLGGGKKLSKVTVSASAPGTLQDGELYLQY